MIEKEARKFFHDIRSAISGGARVLYEHEEKPIYWPFDVPYAYPKTWESLGENGKILRKRFSKFLFL